MKKYTHRAQSEELSDTYGLTPARYKHQQCFQAGDRNDNCNMWKLVLQTVLDWNMHQTINTSKKRDDSIHFLQKFTDRQEAFKNKIQFLNPI